MQLKSLLRDFSLAAIVVYAGANGEANAQFVGDAFFVNPSVAVPAAGEGAVQLALFSGTNVLGAARVSVVYDPAALEILQVDPLTTGDLTPVVRWQTKQGVLTIATVSGGSLTKPFGTVPLVRITFKSLGVVSSRTQLTSSVHEIIKADASALQIGKGFAAEVSVTASSATASSRSFPANQVRSVEPSLIRRASSMRPPGHSVVIESVDVNGMPERVLVQIPSTARTISD